MEVVEPSTFSGRLKAAMEVKGYSANRLAQLLSTSAGRVISWVKADNLPGGEHMTRLPKILQVDGHWLLTGEGEMKPTQPGEAEHKLQLIRDILNTSAPVDLKATPGTEADRARQSAAAALASLNSRELKPQKRRGTGRSGGTASSA